MPMAYKIDVIASLKSAGYSTYKIRKDKLLAESTIQLIRENKPASWENVAAICALLNCQTGNIMEYIPDDTKDGE